MRIRPATTHLLASALSACVWLVGGVASATERPGCLDLIEWQGDVSEELRARLEAGPTATLDPIECVGVRVVVRHDPNSWWVRLERGSEAFEHRTETEELAAVWVESWLALGDAAVEEPVETEPPAADAAVTAEEHADGPPAVQPVATFPVGVEWCAAQRTVLSGVGPLWLGFVADVNVVLGRRSYVGVSLYGAWSPETRQTERRFVGGALRGGIASS